jgi:hypothetical protein
MRPGRFLRPSLASGGLRWPVSTGDGRRPCGTAVPGRPQLFKSWGKFEFQIGGPTQAPMKPGRFLRPSLASGGQRRPVLTGDGRRPCATAVPGRPQLFKSWGKFEFQIGGPTQAPMRPGRFLRPSLASGGLQWPVSTGDGRRPCGTAVPGRPQLCRAEESSNFIQVGLRRPP